MGKDGPPPAHKKVLSRLVDVIFDNALYRTQIDAVLAECSKDSNKISPEEKRLIDAGIMRLILCLHLDDGVPLDLVRSRLSIFSVIAGEGSQTAQLCADMQNRDACIQEDIKYGCSPWLAHIQHNVPSPLTPFIVGFYQEPTGHMRTLYGSRLFRSKRQLQHAPLMFERNEHKTVSLLTTEFQQVNNPEIVRGPYFDLLPTDLKSKFESGEILVTGGMDLYAIKHDDLSNIDQADAVEQHVSSQAIEAAQVGNQYFLLYYGDNGSNDTGRTGVLMTASNGKPQPVLITINNQQFILEIKGCGTKAGGFGGMHQRTGRKILTGGAERSQAINEHARLLETPPGGGPQAVASILFEGSDGYQQGYILRLSPSTVRAAYTGDVYPQIDTAENVQRVIDMYTTELAEHIFSNPPKIMDRSSHTENILLWGNGHHAFTDFSDHALFCDGSYPCLSEQNSDEYLTPLQLLRFYIAMVEEIPGYQIQRDTSYFHHQLQAAFATHGVHISIAVDDDHERIAQKIWQGAMAAQVFLSRRTEHYFAHGILQQVDCGLVKHRDLFKIDSQVDFVTHFAEQKRRLRSFLKNLDTSELGAEKISTINTMLVCIEDNDLLGIINLIDHVFRSLPFAMSTKEEAIVYFSYLYSVLVHPVQGYFSHEVDVLSAIEHADSGVDQEIASQAKLELQSKIAAFKGSFRDIADIFPLMNSASMQQLLTLKYYQHA